MIEVVLTWPDLAQLHRSSHRLLATTRVPIVTVSEISITRVYLSCQWPSSRELISRFHASSLVNSRSRKLTGAHESSYRVYSCDANAQTGILSTEDNHTAGLVTVLPYVLWRIEGLDTTGS